VADGVVGLLMLVGVLIFSRLIFRLLDRQDALLAQQHAELADRYQTEHRLRSQLEGVQQAAIAIASASTGTEILQRLVELAPEIIPARYAALGVLGVHGAIDALYTAGLSVEERQRLGPIPQGHGLLGVTLLEGQAIRIEEISEDPRRVGFPPEHPTMHGLLAVPIRLAGRIIGNLSLADRETGAFTAEDEQILTVVAGHAAVAIEQARLADQVRRLAVSSERERIKVALQDGAIQALFAVNLDLEMALDDLGPTAAGERIEQSIERIGAAMEDIRRSILDTDLSTQGSAQAPSPGPRRASAHVSYSRGAGGRP
jgi:GAF domain-containing protein